VRSTKIYGVARENKKEIKRFGKFAAVGLSGLVVDFFVLNFLTYFLKFEEWSGIAIAFILAACNNFVWNRLWVYPESRRTEKKRKLLPIFVLVNAAGLLINWLIYFTLNKPIDSLMQIVPIALIAQHHQGIGLNITKAIAAVVVMFWNYFVNRRVTFRNVKWEKNAPASHEIESAL
jgi:dolichol-phosphate mannosyltransferase